MKKKISLGIIGFIISIILLSILIYMMYLITEVEPSQLDQLNKYFLWLNRFLTSKFCPFFLLLLLISSITLSIIGLIKKEKSKIFSILGICVSISPFTLLLLGTLD